MINFRRELNRKSTGVQDIVSGMVSCVIGTVVFSMIDRILHKREVTLWIQPSYDSVNMYEFPLYQALRIIRKHDWEPAEVAPIRHISRREALEILIKGDDIK